VLVKGQVAGGDQGGDLVAERFADARNLAELARGDDVVQVRLHLFDGSRRVEVSATAKGVLALQLQDGADLVEDGGDLLFVHDGSPAVSRNETPKQDTRARAGGAIFVRLEKRKGPVTRTGSGLFSFSPLPRSGGEGGSRGL